MKKELDAKVLQVLLWYDQPEIILLKGWLGRVRLGCEFSACC